MKIIAIHCDTGTLLQIEMSGEYPTVQFVTPRHIQRVDALNRAFGCFQSSIPPQHLLFMRDDGGAELWNASMAFKHCHLCGIPLLPANWKACGVYDDEPNRICDSCYNATISET